PTREPDEVQTFGWVGMVLTHEHSSTKPHTTVYHAYNDHSYTSLARIECTDTPANPRCAIYYTHSGLNGLPEALTNGDGHLVWQGQYGVWGNLQRQARPTGEFSSEQNLRFQGQYFDKETGLHYNTFRYYAPDLGRFTQQDPIGLAGGLNLYQYAPNPLTWVDPWGWACRNSQKRFNKRDRITRRYVDLLSGKKPSDVELYLNSKGWKTTYPQSATPQKTQHVVFEKTTKSGEVYHLDYNPSGKTHNSDYWKVIKPNDPVESVYGRIGYGKFNNYDRIKNSPVYIDGSLMNPWSK
ncbi:TPA: RHS repeat-associated core domain-containing protein, partial [Providencia stuartii]